MQFLFDHIVATMVATTVMLILVVTSFRGSTEAMSVTTYQAMVKQADVFTDFFSRDVRSLSRVLSIQETDDVFRFSARVTQGDTTQHTIEYRRVEVGSRGGAPLYEIQRHVDGTPDGSSAPLVTTWLIEARGPDGTLAATPEDADHLHVLIQLATPSETGVQQVIKAATWEADLYPPAIQ